MANIKTKQQHPFQNAAQPRATVGNTYGARRNVSMNSPQAQARPAAAKPLDRFSKAGVKRTGDLSRFNANATFRTAKMRFHEGKPAVMHSLEKGLRPVKLSEKPVTPPSDNAILNFLDKVISDPTYSASKKAAISSKNQLARK
ncbi:MAG TPA: hypothetical protein PLZ86_03805 [bacterium]|nr:hypothetical protein [bacterium]